jgi:DNA-binding beta-propeller fold protein YncE
VVITLGGTSSSAGQPERAREVRLSDPFGVAAAEDGTVFVADAGEAPRILRIAPEGRIDTIAGGARGFADGPGGSARFDTPSGIAIGAGGVLYVADTGNHAIRRISADGHVTTLAGDGVVGDADGLGRLARFNGPIGIAVDGRGRVLVADTYNDRLRAISPDGLVTTVAGTVAGAEDGDALSARFDTPCGVAVDRAGLIYVADTGNGAVRRIDAAGTVATLAREIDGTPMRPIGIAVDPRGAVFVSDERGRVIEIAPDLQARTLAGSISGFADGAGTEARFRRTAGLALAAEGRVVTVDAGNGVLRVVAAPSRAPLLLPRPPGLRPGFDRETFERTPLLWPISPMDGPYEIAGTMGEARGIEGAERFHAGVDVRVDQGTWVRAVRDGAIASPISTGDFGSLNEWLRIGAISYVHVRTGRSRTGQLVDHDGFVAGFDAAGKLARVRVRRGTRFAAGEVIASVNPFNHVHLNVGSPGEEVNPLALRLPFFEDRIPPTIAAGGIMLYDEAWQAIPRRRRQPPIVSGLVRIVLDAWDQADGNRPNRRLGLYSLGYEVLRADGTAAPGFEHPQATIVFDRLAAQPDAAALVYAPGSGIPFYRGRRTRFLYVVTNTFSGGAAAEGFWDTTRLLPGPYTLRIHARDVRGNEAMANRDLKVEVGRR